MMRIDDRNGNLLVHVRGARHQVADRVALDVLHHEVVLLVLDADLEDRNDVRVVEAGREARLVEEHLDEVLLLGEVRVQPFDRDETLETRDADEAREVDGGHASGRELRDELESVEPFSLAGDGENLRHGRSYMLARPPDIRQICGATTHGFVGFSARKSPRVRLLP